jgi:replicative DNA helicase
MESTLNLPCSEDSERGLLCSLLLGRDAVAVEIRVPKEAFYIPAHRLLWETLYELLGEKKPLDFVIIKQRLIDSKKMEEVGGSSISPACTTSCRPPRTSVLTRTSS